MPPKKKDKVYLPTRESYVREQYYFNDPAKKSSWRDQETAHPPKPFNHKPNWAQPDPIRWKPTATGSFPLPGPWAEVFRVPDQKPTVVFDPHTDQYQPHRKTLDRDRTLRDYYTANRKNFEEYLLNQPDRPPPPMKQQQRLSKFNTWSRKYPGRGRWFEKTAAYQTGPVAVRNVRSAAVKYTTRAPQYVRRWAQTNRVKKFRKKVAGKKIATKIGAAFRARKAKAMGNNPFAVPYVSDAALTAAAERVEAAHRLSQSLPGEIAARALRLKASAAKGTPTALARSLDLISAQIARANAGASNPFAVPPVSDEALTAAAVAAEEAMQEQQLTRAVEAAEAAHSAQQRLTRVKGKLAAKTALMRAARASMAVDDFDLMAMEVDPPSRAPKRPSNYAPGFRPPQAKRRRGDGPNPAHFMDEDRDPYEPFYFAEEPADDSWAMDDLAAFDDVGMDIDGSGLYRFKKRTRYPNRSYNRRRRYY